jgi:hypothetical protein
MNKKYRKVSGHDLPTRPIVSFPDLHPSISRNVLQTTGPNQQHKSLVNPSTYPASLGVHCRVWEEDTQKVASKVHQQERLLFEGMAGGVSDIGSGIQFIPKPGRKKRKAAPPVAEDDEEIHNAETTECSDEYSVYFTADCPDVDAEEDSEDELADFIADWTLGDG